MFLSPLLTYPLCPLRPSKYTPLFEGCCSLCMGIPCSVADKSTNEACNDPILGYNAPAGEVPLDSACRLLVSTWSFGFRVYGGTSTRNLCFRRIHTSEQNPEQCMSTSIPGLLRILCLYLTDTNNGTLLGL